MSVLTVSDHDQIRLSVTNVEHSATNLGLLFPAICTKTDIECQALMQKIYNISVEMHHPETSGKQ
jgi:hypothetical protein